MCVIVVGEPVSKKREEMEIMTEREADADKNMNRPQVKEPVCIKQSYTELTMLSPPLIRTCSS